MSAVKTNADNLGYFNPPNVYKPAILNIELIGEYDPADGAFNTYRITQNDGKVFDFKVKNGSGGSTGLGIDNVEEIVVSTESSGVNVIRITFTDGTYQDFQVRNGAKGDKGDQGIPGPAGIDSVTTEVEDPEYSEDGPEVEVGQITDGVLPMTFKHIQGPQGVSIDSVEQTTVATNNGGTNVVRITLDNGEHVDINIKNGKASYGLFPTAADLPANPSVGDYAFVGSNFPADIYVCASEGVWSDSGEDYDGDDVDLTDYATKEEVSELGQEVGRIEGEYNYSFDASGVQCFKCKLEAGKKYVFKFVSGSGYITTVKSVAGDSYYSTTIDNFLTGNALTVGAKLSVVPTQDADYLAIYNSAAVVVSLVYQENIIDTFSELKSKTSALESAVITKGVYTLKTTANGDVYGLKDIRLVSGHKYRFDISADGTISGTQLSLKISTSNGSTYYNLNSQLLGSNGSWNGTKQTYTYIATEDLFTMMVGSYYQGITANANITLTITDMTVSEVLDVESKLIHSLQTRGEYSVSGSGDVYGLFYCRLVKNHSYRIDVTADNSISGSHLSLKIATGAGSTYAELTGDLLSSGSWDGTKKSFTYIANEDKFDMKIGSYCTSISSGAKVTVSFTDITTDKELEEIGVLNTLALTKSIYTLNTIGNGSVYGFKKVRLIRGHSYRFDISADSSISGTQVSLKIADGTTDATYATISGQLLNNGTWDGSVKSFYYVASEDKLNMNIGSYYQGITDNANITLVFTDITLERVQSNDATHIAQYYAQFEKEFKNVEYLSNLNILFFSDVHGHKYNKTNVERIVQLANSLQELDVVINGGDTLYSLITPESEAGDDYLDDLDWYNAIVNTCQADVLTCVGNHDAWMGPFEEGVFNWADLKDVYQLVTKEVVLSGAHNGSPIIQPSNAEQNGYCYYYKDYGDIRVIVLNAMENESHPSGYWDATQIAWFESVLDDARTHSKKVICVSHCPSDLRTAQRVNSSFTSIRDYTWGEYDAILTPSSAFDIVDSFIDNGGTFICWLTGHTHYDQLLTPARYNNQLQIDIASARYDYHNDGYKVTDISDVSNPVYDCCNYIGIDVTHKLIKVFRIGWDMDGGMKVRYALCYNYDTNNII